MLIADQVLKRFKGPVRDEFHAKLSRATYVKIQNVADYLYQGCEQEEWAGDDFPNVAPPWEKIWMEWRIPKEIITDQKPLFDCDYESMPGGLFKVKQPIAVPFGAMLESRYFENYGWLLIATLFAPLAQDTPFFYAELFIIQTSGKIWEFPVGRENAEHAHRLFEFMWGSAVPFSYTPGDGSVIKMRLMLNPVLAEKIRSNTPWPNLGIPALLALSFCNCRNVITKQHRIPAPLIKKSTKHQRLGLKSFYTIEIGAIKKVLDESAQMGTSLQKRLHICRGHFKHFNEDKKLFGKHEGIFWWPMHARGNAALGEVVKDYEVKP